uniref:Reverse transcriptase Ty1/copia-type domain-containing protein n=1 Tax=Physcomitrium patens TaxID=3218 RepID=A0A2K1J7M2_PHYPA|nr:hypothetical protein PHYPA_020628 [Physcomitrium patens]
MVKNSKGHKVWNVLADGSSFSRIKKLRKGRSEYQTMRVKNATWSLMPLFIGKKTINSCWIYKIKSDIYGGL